MVLGPPDHTADFQTLATNAALSQSLSVVHVKKKSRVPVGPGPRTEPQQTQAEQMHAIAWHGRDDIRRLTRLGPVGTFGPVRA